MKQNGFWNSNCANISYINMNPMPKYTPCLVFNRIQNEAKENQVSMD
jgi:hypothetical protein